MTLLEARDTEFAHGFETSRVDDLRARIETIHQEISIQPAPAGLVPLHIACHSSDCRNGLHCLDYIRTGRAGTSHAGTPVAPGQCRACRDAVTNLPAHRADTVDQVAALFDQQRRELIREHYWTAPMDLWAYNQAYRLGRIGLHAKARKTVAERVGSARHIREGQQTGWNRDVIAYAQHGVAACCRRCIEYWYGFAQGRPLTDDELQYLTGLVTVFLDVRFPGLPDQGSKPPSIRTADLPIAGDPFDLRRGLAMLLEQGQTPAGLLVPGSLFDQLKTDVTVNETGGSVAMRVVTQQLALEIESPARKAS